MWSVGGQLGCPQGTCPTALSAKGPERQVRLRGGAGETIDNGLRPMGDKGAQVKASSRKPLLLWGGRVKLPKNLEP